MNRNCEVSDCPSLARPHRRTCATHRARIHRDSIPVEPVPSADLEEVEFVVRERMSAAGLPRPEQRLVVLELAGCRVPAAEVARLVGVSERTVYRWREAA
ncbi:helix-turn-helix domain-containing protein [Streptomyces sp. NPDC096310]|uniref:helix-turn-helix domain-containing protein n=1 Tax=Streptomyces sp. NPDC096310 TaxID=3366082 RepID=UPI003820E8EC